MSAVAPSADTAPVEQSRSVALVEAKGHTPHAVVVSTAELAECACPDFCERDHDVD